MARKIVTVSHYTLDGIHYEGAGYLGKIYQDQEAHEQMAIVEPIFMLKTQRAYDENKNWHIVSQDHIWDPQAYPTYTIDRNFNWFQRWVNNLFWEEYMGWVSRTGSTRLSNIATFICTLIGRTYPWAGDPY